MNTPVPAQTTPDADFFRALEARRTRAIVDRDMPTIEILHAPDYELISPPGRVMTRERYLSLIAAEPFYASWEHGAMRVRVSEAMAAVRYQAKITFPSGKVVDCWHTDVYQLHGGTWKAIWSQATQAAAGRRALARRTAFTAQQESFFDLCLSLSAMPAVIGQQRGECMLYRKNVGSKESVARVLGGALLVACSLSQIGTTPLGVVLAAGGVLTALTGLFGYCPACAIAGRKPLDALR